MKKTFINLLIISLTTTLISCSSSDEISNEPITEQDLNKSLTEKGLVVLRYGEYQFYKIENGVSTLYKSGRTDCDMDGKIKLHFDGSGYTDRGTVEVTRGNSVRKRGYSLINNTISFEWILLHQGLYFSLNNDDCSNFTGMGLGNWTNKFEVSFEDEFLVLKTECKNSFIEYDNNVVIKFYYHQKLF